MSAPSASRTAARSRPRRSGSSSGPVAERRSAMLASSLPAKASRSSSAPFSPWATVASAPTGAVQPASSAARSALSALTAARVSGSSSALRASITSGRSSRHSTASAPCPGAGSICWGSSDSVTSSSRPRRASPARASRTASQEPLRTNEIRVSTLPRMSMTLQVQAKGRQLGRPPRGAGADHRSGRKLTEGSGRREPRERHGDLRERGSRRSADPARVPPADP